MSALEPARVTAPPSGWRAAESPFHAGELAAQERAGVRERMDVDARRGIRDYMPDQHRRFFAEQPFMVLGGVDETGQPWATLRVGAPGFISTPDERTLRIAGRSLAGDPIGATWQVGSVVGGLGIQPATRRRNRVNGVVTAIDDQAITVAVSQSFGNCAKYIQSRTPVEFHVEEGSAAAPLVSNRLSDADRALLARADTFFVATANTSSEAGMGRGADVSHRGGAPGFIRIDEDDTLTTPDFSGNLFFNTIGNLMQDPRAGLLVIDFDSGDLLYLAVDAEIIWEGAELDSFDGAERLIRWHVREVRRTPGALPMRWSSVQYAPQLANLGSWKAQEATPAVASAWRKLKVSDVRDEAPGVRSFYFEAADGSALPAYEPGQFLPIRLHRAGLEAPLIRTYTLSDAHQGRRYRITVKREGVASTWLHENVKAGMQIEAKAPGGAFVLDRTSSRAVVLLSAGIGITPMVAMLNSLLTDTSGRAQPEHIYFIHGARRSGEHPFADELKAAEQAHSNLSVYLRDSQAEAGPVGRVDIAYLKSVLPFGDYDFYLCGPGAFMQDMYSGLRALNIADDRIRFEAFGPASVKRTESAVRALAVAKPVAPRDPERSSKVVFMRTHRDAQWSPEDGSLLDFAEANGVSAASNCRSGVCGTCATRVLSGDVTYPAPCEAEIPAGHALICSAIPARIGSGEASAVVLDL
ncbi:pyridoxamine 5'-phosphate oxidase family protein [Caballeronia sordidicola]|uniref:2Fe-2S iron-sulfur cluster-binding protein n=1 Tax=Caballeronia sordidicola TaxID=196367 RepID=UPI0004D0108B|nr:pyridoxamine 5'-phosphate oxidase family protein [Caballeronia sordidicola]